MAPLCFPKRIFPNDCGLHQRFLLCSQNCVHTETLTFTWHNGSRNHLKNICSRIEKKSLYGIIWSFCFKGTYNIQGLFHVISGIIRMTVKYTFLSLVYKTLIDFEFHVDKITFSPVTVQRTTLVPTTTVFK